MKKIMSAAAVALLATAAPAFAATTVNVPFTSQAGVSTAEAFSGLVRVTVSGTGFSNGNAVNDAFYSTTSQTRNTGLYQLGFATAGSSFQAVANSIFGGVVPTYSANNTYSFVLNTNLAQAGALTFRVLDDNFADNGGSYSVSVAAVPEPATWGMMLVGFGMIGFGVRAQRKSTKVTYA